MFIQMSCSLMLILLRRFSAASVLFICRICPVVVFGLFLELGWCVKGLTARCEVSDVTHFTLPAVQRLLVKLLSDAEADFSGAYRGGGLDVETALHPVGCPLCGLAAAAPATFRSIAFTPGLHSLTCMNRRVEQIMCLWSLWKVKSCI